MVWMDDMDGWYGWLWTVVDGGAVVDGTDMNNYFGCGIRTPLRARALVVRRIDPECDAATDGPAPAAVTSWSIIESESD